MMDNKFNTIWRVNLRSQSFKREPVPKSWDRLGGRALIARILVDELPGTCDHWGRKISSFSRRD